NALRTAHSELGKSNDQNEWMSVTASVTNNTNDSLAIIYEVLEGSLSEIKTAGTLLMENDKQIEKFEEQLNILATTLAEVRKEYHQTIQDMSEKLRKLRDRKSNLQDELAQERAITERRSSEQARLEEEIASLQAKLEQGLKQSSEEATKYIRFLEQVARETPDPRKSTEIRNVCQMLQRTSGELMQLVEAEKTWRTNYNEISKQLEELQMRRKYERAHFKKMQNQLQNAFNHEKDLIENKQNEIIEKLQDELQMRKTIIANPTSNPSPNSNSNSNTNANANANANANPDTKVNVNVNTNANANVNVNATTNVNSSNNDTRLAQLEEALMEAHIQIRDKDEEIREMTNTLNSLTSQSPILLSGVTANIVTEQDALHNKGGDKSRNKNAISSVSATPHLRKCRQIIGDLTAVIRPSNSPTEHSVDIAKSKVYFLKKKEKKIHLKRFSKTHNTQIQKKDGIDILNNRLKIVQHDQEVMEKKLHKLLSKYIELGGNKDDVDLFVNDDSTVYSLFLFLFVCLFKTGPKLSLAVANEQKQDGKRESSHLSPHSSGKNVEEQKRRESMDAIRAILEKQERIESEKEVLDPLKKEVGGYIQLLVFQLFLHNQYSYPNNI
ncbi:rhoptry protein, partial [Reticulomyxa filosa]